MRIVAVADTHTFQAGLEVPDGDVFIHAGDLLGSGSLSELRPVAEWLRSLPHLHKVVVAGNHDWCFVRDPANARALLGDATYLEDSGTTIDGVTFWGSPWQPEFLGWAFNLPRGGPLRAKWARIPAGTDVLITHGPPRGIGDRAWGAHLGCDDLREAVDGLRPSLHVFGHIHEDGGFWEESATAFANVTTDDCQRGATVIDLDPSSRRAVPVHVP